MYRKQEQIPFEFEFADGEVLRGKRRPILRPLEESVRLSEKFVTYGALFHQIQQLNEDKIKNGATVETINKLSQRQQPFISELGKIMAQADSLILEVIEQWDYFDTKEDEAAGENRLPVTQDVLNSIEPQMRVALAGYLLNAGAKVDKEGKKPNGDLVDTSPTLNQETAQMFQSS